LFTVQIDVYQNAIEILLLQCLLSGGQIPNRLYGLVPQIR
jgi:hypothetical protein